MPLVQISIRKCYSAAEKGLINKALHQALLVAFKIPEHDFNHRIHEYEAENFPIPPGKTERYMIIEMTIFPGRSKQAKEFLFSEVCKNLAELSLSPEDILIVLHEPQLANWGINGVSAENMDLGFKLDV